MQNKKRICSCRVVVERTYRELMEKDVPENLAFDISTRVFRLRHPEATELDARFTIAEWLAANA